nr:unnamed protein product [Callosobruchus analis]
MNDQILGLLDGDYTTYLSDDSIETEDDDSTFTVRLQKGSRGLGLSVCGASTVLPVPGQAWCGNLKLRLPKSKAHWDSHFVRRMTVLWGIT